MFTKIKLHALSYVFERVKETSSQQKKRTSTEDKFNALQEIESGQPKSLVAQKYGVPRNTISPWILPQNKEKIMAAFSYGTTNLKRKYQSREI